MGVEGNDAAQGDASIVFHQPTNYCCFTRWLGEYRVVIEWLTQTFCPLASSERLFRHEINGRLLHWKCCCGCSAFREVGGHRWLHRWRWLGCLLNDAHE